MLWLKKNTIPLLVGCVLAFLLWLSIPLTFNAYTLKLIGKDANEKVNQLLWADVDGDGVDECISCGGSEGDEGVRRHGCSIRKTYDSFVSLSIEQANVSELPMSPYLSFFADINGNKKAELYIAEIVGNSIWLNGFEYPNFNIPFIHTKIDTFIRYSGACNIYLSPGFQNDIDGDGIDELYFSIRNSYLIYPRRHYRLNVISGELLKSPSTCMDIGFSSIDSTSNPKISYTGSSGSSGNFKDSLNIPYSDYFSYSLALNEDLEFHFDPIMVNAYPGGATNILSDGFIFCYVNRSINESPNTLIKFSLEGEKLDSILLDEQIATFRLHNNRMILIIGHKIYELDIDLQLTLLNEFEQLSILSNPMSCDLTKDNLNELVFTNFNTKELFVLSSDYEHLTSTYFQLDCSNKVDLAVRHLANQADQLICTDLGEIEYFTYQANLFHPFKYAYWFGLFFSSLGISLWSFGRFRKGIEKRHQQELEMNRFQMLAIKNQVDPHFTLNALNSIDFMYQNDEKERAGKFMVKLSRLMHQTLMNSDKMTCSLYEELDFIRTYCQLEEVRSITQFTFEIIVAEEIDPVTIEIPKQLLFTFVENAIKHGLRPKENGGLLSIHISKNPTNTLITIRDNGIGYKASKKIKTSTTGKGLQIVKDIIRLYKSLKGKSIKVETSTSEKGTLVTISIPKKKNDLL